MTKIHDKLFRHLSTFWPHSYVTSEQQDYNCSMKFYSLTETVTRQTKEILNLDWKYRTIRLRLTILYLPFLNWLSFMRRWIDQPKEGWLLAVDPTEVVEESSTEVASGGDCQKVRKAGSGLGIQSGMTLSWMRHLPYAFATWFSNTTYSSTSFATTSLP